MKLSHASSRREFPQYIILHTTTKEIIADHHAWSRFINKHPEGTNELLEAHHPQNTCQILLQFFLPITSRETEVKENNLSYHFR